MDLNRLTQKSQDALHDAQTKASRFGHQEMDGEHLLLALLDQPDGIVPRLLEEPRTAVFNALRGHFRPEFLNRIDETVLFKPLTCPRSSASST